MLRILRDFSFWPSSKSNQLQILSQVTKHPFIITLIKKQTYINTIYNYNRFSNYSLRPVSIRFFSSSDSLNNSKNTEDYTDPNRRDRIERLKQKFEQFKKAEKNTDAAVSEESALKEILDDYPNASEADKQDFVEYLKEVSDNSLKNNVDRFNRPNIAYREGDHTRQEAAVQERLSYRRKMHKRNQWWRRFSFWKVEARFIRNSWTRYRHIFGVIHQESIQKGVEAKEELEQMNEREARVSPVNTMEENQSQLSEGEYHDIIPLTNRVFRCYPHGFTMEDAIHWADHLYVQKHIKEFKKAEELKILRMLSIDLQWQGVAMSPTWSESWLASFLFPLFFWFPFKMYQMSLFCLDIGGPFYLGLIPLVPLTIAAIPLIVAQEHRAIIQIGKRYKIKGDLYQYHEIIMAIEKRMKELYIDPQAILANQFVSTEHTFEIARKMAAHEASQQTKT